MQVRYWKDQDGQEWREAIHNKYSVILSVSEAHRADGWKTWINVYNDKKWMVTMTKYATAKIDSYQNTK